MTKKTITRRTLLKSILAGGTVVGASAFLPEKWVKPLVESGVLPVHAQVSVTNGSISGTIQNVTASSMDGGITYASFGNQRPRNPQAHPVDGQTINLYIGETAAGEPFKTTLTDATGYYEFLDLAPGTYTVCWQDTGQCKPPIQLASGQAAVLNFIYQVLNGSITGTLYMPSDAQIIKGGIASVGFTRKRNRPQPSLINQTINLYPEGTAPTVMISNLKNASPKQIPEPIQTTLTNDFGEYAFNNVPPGTYDVYWVENNQWKRGKVVTSGNTTIVDFTYEFPV